MKLMLILSLTMIAAVALAPHASAACASLDPPTHVLIDLEQPDVEIHGECAEVRIVGSCTRCGRD